MDPAKEDEPVKLKIDVYKLRQKVAHLESEIEVLYRQLDELDEIIAERDETIFLLKRRNVELMEWVKNLS